jgi:hypothetical protein
MRSKQVVSRTWEISSFFLLLVVGGCYSGGSGDVSSPAAAGMVQSAGTASAASHTTVVEWSGEDMFKLTGTNLLKGAWAKLQEQETPEAADNSYCYVCHANYQNEELTSLHTPLGVGCETCHGMSDNHSADEDGLTPPEIMWPKPWINISCMECHPYDDLEREVAHEEFLAKPLADQVCTDCHGLNHRLSVRTRVWDRQTGKLTSCDGVRMMDADSPAASAR